jgi:allantoin racemase
MKIMVVMGEYPPEEAERRRRATLRCASPGTEIRFGVIRGTFFAHHSSEATALAAAPLVGEVAKQAEADGCDAVVPFGTLDVGVQLSRNLVRIPVVGAGQSVLHLGTQLSDRLGVISYEQKSIPFMRKNMRLWGVERYVISIQSVEIPLAESTNKRAAMRERFLATARRQIDELGAEIIVPMGVTMVPVHYPAAEFSAELGFPVLDALATSIQTAEMMVRMGVSHSAKSYPRVET